MPAPRILRDLFIPLTSRGSPNHLAGGSSPHEADLPFRAGVELAHHGSVSWLADRRRRPPTPETISRWHAGRKLPAHSCATAPDLHRLPVTRDAIQLWSGLCGVWSGSLRETAQADEQRRDDCCVTRLLQRLGERVTSNDRGEHTRLEQREHHHHSERDDERPSLFQDRE